MAILKIKKYPDPVLRVKCKEVETVDSEIRHLLDDMAMTMYSVNGVGLAAPQVGLDIRIVVIDIGEGLLKLVNPKIIEQQGLSIIEEGCLSVPDVYVKVRRAAKLEVSCLDEYGKPQLFHAEGLLAHAMQQEIDHINGKLIIDYLPLYKRLFIKKG